MEISDIQIVNEHEKITEITFCDPSENYDDCLKLKISIEDMSTIYNFCQTKLNFNNITTNEN